MFLDDYKVVLYRNWPLGWVAEIPSIPGCYALMPTRAEAISELEQVFLVLVDEYRNHGAFMPVDTTKIVRPGVIAHSGIYEEQSNTIVAL